EITLIQGWNWYAGSDTAAIGAGQYDFETVLVHELGHALGLGHSATAGSVMYPTLDAGAVNRSLATADLNVADSDTGADGLHAAIAPLAPVSAAALSFRPIAGANADARGYWLLAGMGSDLNGTDRVCALAPGLAPRDAVFASFAASRIS